MLEYFQQKPEDKNPIINGLFVYETTAPTKLKSIEAPAQPKLRDVVQDLSKAWERGENKSNEEIATALRDIDAPKETVKDIRWLVGQNLKLKETSTEDPLTKLYNRRFLVPALEHEMKMTERSEKPTSFIMLDIDHFKNVNDKLGHLIGDTALEIMAKIIKKSSRESDIVGRWGGEEFVLILPETNEEDAEIVAEKLRHNVETKLRKELIKAYPNKEADILEHVDGTISVGISTYDGMNKEESELLIEEADTAMYLCKEKGRNQYAAYTPGMRGERKKIEDAKKATENKPRVSIVPDIKENDEEVLKSEEQFLSDLTEKYGEEKVRKMLRKVTSNKELGT